MNRETTASISSDPMNPSPVTVKRRSDSAHVPQRQAGRGDLAGQDRPVRVFMRFLRVPAIGFRVVIISGVFASCTSKPCSLERIGSHLSATFDVLTSKKALPYHTTLYWTNHQAGYGKELGSRLNSESLDSIAPAHLKLVRFPARSLLSSQLYVDHSPRPLLAPAT